MAHLSFSFLLEETVPRLGLFDLDPVSCICSRLVPVRYPSCLHILLYLSLLLNSILKVTYLYMQSDALHADDQTWVIFGKAGGMMGLPVPVPVGCAQSPACSTPAGPAEPLLPQLLLLRR